MPHDPTTSAAPPIVDRSAARALLEARYADESAGAPDGCVAERCTAHGAFLGWVSAPAFPGVVECGPGCPS